MADKVLTANRLSDGISVWLDAAGHWVESLQDAFVARHAEAVSALEATGKAAFADNKVVDVNVIDMDALALEVPLMAYDLPAGGKRLIQGARGYDATVVSGVVTRRHGADTGARPGALLRGVR